MVCPIDIAKFLQFWRIAVVFILFLGFFVISHNIYSASDLFGDFVIIFRLWLFDYRWGRGPDRKSFAANVRSVSVKIWPEGDVKCTGGLFFWGWLWKQHGKPIVNCFIILYISYSNAIQSKQLKCQKECGKFSKSLFMIMPCNIGIV
jgi:hypothetical protein